MAETACDRRVLNGHFQASGAHVDRRQARESENGGTFRSGSTVRMSGHSVVWPNAAGSTRNSVTHMATARCKNPRSVCIIPAQVMGVTAIVNRAVIPEKAPGRGSHCRASTTRRATTIAPRPETRANRMTRGGSLPVGSCRRTTSDSVGMRRHFTS